MGARKGGQRKGGQYNGDYGHVKWQGRLYVASRLVWESHHGPIPTGLVVCHRCDVPACVNVEHLFLGTHKANAADKIAKKRHPHGLSFSLKLRGKAGVKKFSDDVVRAVRAASGTQRAIAKHFGMCQGMVSRIRNGKHRGYVPDHSIATASTVAGRGACASRHSLASPAYSPLSENAS